VLTIEPTTREHPSLNLQRAITCSPQKLTPALSGYHTRPGSPLRLPNTAAQVTAAGRARPLFGGELVAGIELQLG